MSDSIEKVNNEKENIELYLLNPKNKYITVEFIENLLKTYKIDWKIKDLKIYQHAMTHESYLKRQMTSSDIDKIWEVIKVNNLKPIDVTSFAIPLQTESYERLEFLGDSIIHFAIADYLFKRYPNENEGFMTKLRNKIENRHHLSKLAESLNLIQYVLLSGSIEQTGGRELNYHIFEDTFEAFLGALYVDTNGNSELCKTFVINIIETNVDFANLIGNENNYKDELMKYCHKKKWPVPVYEHVDTVEKDKKKFNIHVIGPGGKIIGRGYGPSKKKGEQNAAFDALQQLGLIKDNDSDDEIYDEISE